MTKPQIYHGFLVVDKPGGLTSREVVDQIQSAFPRGTRIGHTGTLDPLATGVLVMAVGAGTRLTEYVQQMEKLYEARIRLGATSDTDDADGTLKVVERASPPSAIAVHEALETFVGQIEQVPPAYSAAKLTGRRAYALARRGKEVTLKPRPVQVFAIHVLDYSYPLLTVQVRCGKGTYVRSLARDLGRRLGCGGLIEQLRRIRVGHFTEALALEFPVASETARARLLPLADAVGHLPGVSLDANAIRALGQGKSLQNVRVEAQAVGSTVALFDGSGQLVGIGRFDGEKRVLVPEKMFLAMEQ